LDASWECEFTGWGNGKENVMRAMLCGCERRLEADDYEGLVKEVLDHLIKEHSEIALGEPQVRVLREIVAVCSYRFE
jgi:predicted small metal-binding protein